MSVEGRNIHSLGFKMRSFVGWGVKSHGFLRFFFRTAPDILQPTHSGYSRGQHRTAPLSNLESTLDLNQFISALLGTLL